MKDKKIIEILLKVIKKLYDQNNDLQELIDPTIVALEKVYLLNRCFFILLFTAVFIIMAILEKNLNKSVEDIIFLWVKKQLMKILGGLRQI